MDTSVVFMSIRDDINARLHAVRCGSVSYFTKPLNIDRLIHLIDDVTSERQNNPFRVVIIDDDKSLADFYALILKQAGLSVTTVNNPLEALDVINDKNPEIILMDIFMPDCNGIELASIIRQQEKYTGISILFLTSEKDFDRQLAMMDMGGDNFLSKPVEPEYLVTSVISRVYRARKLNDMTANLISTLSELENQHLALDEHAIVSITDVNGVMTYVNDKFCEISDYSREELIGKNHNILKSGQHDAAFYADMWEILKQQKVWHNEVCNRKKNGELYWVDMTITPFTDENHKIYQYVAIETNITSRVLAEKDLVKARDTAISTSQAKSDFLSRISHELRTPLNAILGFSQLLESMDENPLSKTQTEYSYEIRNAGSHLLKLINELLDLSRIEAGQLKIDLIAVPLSTVLDECCSLLSPLAKERNIKMIDNYHELEDLFVRADPVRLKEILVNLLSNAIKYNHEGGTIRINFQQTDMDRIRVEIVNTGHGIPTDQLEKLFKPFTRLKMYQEEEGTGIGLVLSKRLVELMGGNIGVDNTLDNETLFWIDIAREIVNVKTTDTESTQPNKIKIKTRTQLKCTMLYVEDNKTNLKLVREILGHRPNIKLLHAESAETGLEMAETHKIDLILMDLQLPGMDGFDGLQAIRKDSTQQNIPAIAISSLANPDVIQHAFEVGFEEFVSKPIDVMNFLNTIDTLTEGMTR